MSLTDDILMHYGMPRRSGRYPWGSGDNPYQHSGDFLSRVEELKSPISLLPIKMENLHRRSSYCKIYGSEYNPISYPDEPCKG